MFEWKAVVAPAESGGGIVEMRLNELQISGFEIVQVIPQDGGKVLIVAKKKK